MPNTGDLNLKFDGPSGGNQVTAEVLIRTLQGVQNAIWELAKFSTSEAISTPPSRLRLPNAIKDTFAIHCRAVEPGSFLLKLAVGTVASLIALPAAESNQVAPSTVLSQYMDFMQAVSRMDDIGMKRAVPDSFWRERLVRESLKFLPKQEDNWWVDMQSSAEVQPTGISQTRTIRFDKRYRAVAQHLLERGQSDSEEVTSFIARIDSVDFKTESITVFYPPTSKKLKFKYQFDAEVSLVESRRRLVEIKALCNLDAEGHPLSVTEVRSIAPHDLSPLNITTVFDVDNNREFIVSPPLRLIPKSDDDSNGSFIVVDDESLRLSACAGTRADLEEEVISTLIFLWDNYAEEDDETLSPDALELKVTIRSRMKIMETADAS